jgi:hypothetical protein
MRRNSPMVLRSEKGIRAVRAPIGRAPYAPSRLEADRPYLLFVKTLDISGISRGQALNSAGVYSYVGL